MQYFNLTYYLPLAKKHIKNISVEIKTDQNQFVDFTFGKTILQLHLRACNSFRNDKD